MNRTLADPALRGTGKQLPSTQRSLPMALLRARETVMARFRPVLAAHDVTEQQWRVLRVLAEAGPRDATDLAGASCLLMPSMTRIIRALEGRNLVTRGRDPDDGRRLVITITPEGMRLLNQVAPLSEAEYRRIEENYGRERVEVLLDMLDELARIG